jgi:E3 ubiquitin-protein ligase UBR4
MSCLHTQALLAEQEVSSSGTQGQTITEQILHIMDIILMEASGQSPDKYKVWGSVSVFTLKAKTVL